MKETTIRNNGQHKRRYSEFYPAREVVRFFALSCLLIAGSMAMLGAQAAPSAGKVANPARGWFERPRALTDANLRYVQTLQYGERVVVLYQKITRQDSEGGEMAVAGRLVEADGSLGGEFSIVTGLPFIGLQAPPLYSAVLDAEGRLYLAYAVAAQSIALLASQDALAGKGGALPAFVELGRLESDTTLVSPRLFIKRNHEFVLLATQSTTTAQTTLFSQSPDGRTWSPPVTVDALLDKSINASPFWLQSGATEYIILQSLSFINTQPGVANYYQLYLMRSDDAGKSWGDPVLVTSFGNPGEEDATAISYDNQRPMLVAKAAGLQLFWERGFKTDRRQIWRVDLDAQGKREGDAEKITANPEGALAPGWISYRGQEYLSWFTALNNRAFLSWKENKVWQTREMSAGRSGLALYPAYGFTAGKLHYFYYERRSAGALATNLIYVEPDQRASPPIIGGVNFNNGQRATLREIRFRFLPNSQPAPDASGIAGYSYVLGSDPEAPVPERVMVEGGDNIPARSLDEDGTWYIRARAVDKAGNWSEPAMVSYTLDTTPPDPVGFSPVAVDEKGYLVSNTFAIGWQSPPQDDVAEYGWSLQFLGNISLTEAFAKVAKLESLPEMGRQKTLNLSRRNVANGIYVLAVWSYDRVGNRSEPRIIQLYANKYVPSTVVDFITVKEDLLGERYLSVQGEGFTQNGTIVRLVLDRDGIAPWDSEFFLNKGEFRVESDRLVSGLRLDKLLSGNYLLGVEHSERGFEFGGRRLQFIEHGVIKFGDFTLGADTSYRATVDTGLKVQGGSLLLYLVMALLVIIIFFSGLQIRAVVRDSQLLERTALALADGTATPIREAERKVSTMKRQRLGLRVKFTIFFLSLVIAVVLVISLPLSSYTLANQKAVLAKGLQDRLNVLMESLQSSASIYLQTPDTYGTELAQLTLQGRIMPEVSYITITGQGRGNSDNFDTVWSTSDIALTGEQPAESRPVTAITQRQRAPYTIDGQESNAWFVGRSGITDSLSAETGKLRGDFDQRFREGLGDLPDQINSNSLKFKSLLNNTTKEGQDESARVEAILKSLREQLNTRQRELAGEMDSKPKYDYATYDPAVSDYIFFKPIYFRVAGEDAANARYYRGLVRIGVSTTPINQAISSTQNEILQRILLFAAIAVGGGLVFAIILSSIIVIPIRRLVRGVEEIRQIITLDPQGQETRFGEFLKAGSLNLTSRDELATLGGSISEMVDGLHHAASANKDLVAGSDIQRKFMPLDKVGDLLGTTGGANTPKTEIFGYYEGAKGVSGDFLNFQQIAPGLWACIKCDISGKGIPAALIMVEVATVFLSYFTDWQRKEAERKKMISTGGKALKNDGILVPLVTTINDLVNEREFPGRFAAFDVVLYDENTGSCIFCHAGDQTVYILRDRNRAVETIQLQSTPAAGMFSSKDQFPPFFRCREERNQLEIGDCLMFFTDGIDESRRFFRNPDFSLYLATQEDVEKGRIPDEDHGSVAAQNKAADGSNLYEYEQFTWDRMIAVSEAVRKRSSYRLVKYFNPIPDEELDFDFSGLEGTGRDIVIALAAVEKVFRIIPDPKAGVEDRIMVDRVVDDFLKVHFRQYSSYFRHEREGSKNVLYREFTHLTEEAQYDDLAFLTIRRKPQV